VIEGLPSLDSAINPWHEGGATHESPDLGVLWASGFVRAMHLWYDSDITGTRVYLSLTTKGQGETL
jgi:hypothetical protein